MQTKKLLLAPLVLLSAIPKALAHCPLCSAATGAAVVAARFYGVNDAIVGVFIGAFTLSTGLWFSNALKKRGFVFPAQSGILSAAGLLITVASLQIAKLFEASESLLGMPSLLTGLLIGSAVSAVAYSAHQIIRKAYSNRNLIPLQGLIVILTSLFITVVSLGIIL